MKHGGTGFGLHTATGSERMGRMQGVAMMRLRLRLPAGHAVVRSLLLLATGFGLASAQDASAVSAVPGANVDPAPGPDGAKPYEMAGREEKRAPLATFVDCTEWVVECENAEAHLYRTKEQRLFREYCGKLVYRATGDSPVVTVRLAKKRLIPGPSDCVNFWNYGCRLGWAREPDRPPLGVAALVEGADGEERAIKMGRMNYKYWFLMHARLKEAIPAPVHFTGFRFTNGKNTEDRAVYLGPVYFYTEEFEPLTFEPWPETLPFPTRDTTILPTNKTAVFENRVEHSRKKTVFSYVGEDCTLRYRYTPKTGTLDDIALLFDGRKVQPCKGGGIELEGPAPDSKRIASRLVGQEFDGEQLTVRWDYESDEVATTVTMRLRMVQKSLIVEFEEEEDTGHVAQLSLGRAEPVRDPKLFWVPYLTYTYNVKSKDPRILYSDGLFYFAQFDWYFSDASALFAKHGIEGDSAAFNGGARYIPKTDGRRNPLRERLFLTASPDVQEVLPTIPNPPSPFKDLQGERQFRVRFGDDRQAEVANAQRLRSLGLEKVTVRYHENTWRDECESFTFRLDAAPSQGGNAGLRDMVARVQACDWFVGLYTNYTDLAPVNSYWDEDWTTRGPDGDWLPAWMRCYQAKPMFAVQMEAMLAPQIKERYGQNHSYCDVHTAVTPFARVDYDARVPGAGTFRRTFECYGRLLYNEKHAYQGPVCSEGHHHWWYAGLTDMNYAQLTSASGPREPLFVDFDLLKIHPLEMDAAMGAPGMFFQGVEVNEDQYIATTLAYGHIGYVGYESDEASLMRMYYMVQPLQRHYSMVPVEEIAYEHEGRLLDTSEALVSGAYEQSRVFVAYENGFRVWVNGSSLPWRVAALGREFELPPWGYLGAASDGETYSYSAEAPAIPGVPSHRIDLSNGPDSHYLDARGAFAWSDGLATDGAGALKREAAGWELIPARGFSEFGFDPEQIGLADSDIVVECVPLGDSAPSEPEVRWSRGMVYVIVPSETDAKYRLSSGTGARPVEIDCRSFAVAPREAITARLPSGLEVDASSVCWILDDTRYPAAVSIDAENLTVALPGELPANKHLWLRINGGPDAFWLDFLTASH